MNRGWLERAVVTRGHEIRQENCKHILAVGVHVAKRRRQRPHACNDGWVTMSQSVVDPETGEESEEYALYLCRKCAERS